MILARLSAAIRQQNWFAVVLEFIIVIAGVVIGFQITEWRARAAEDGVAERAAHDLLEEMETNVWMLRAANAETARLNESRDLAARSTADPALRADPESRIRAEEGVLSLSVHPPVAVSRAVYDELVATGSLRLIRDRDARRAASRFFSEVAYAQNQLDYLHDTQLYDALPAHVGLFWSDDAPDGFGNEVDLDALSADPRAVSELMIARLNHVYFQRLRDNLLERAESACAALASAADRPCRPLEAQP